MGRSKKAQRVIEEKEEGKRWKNKRIVSEPIREYDVHFKGENLTVRANRVSFVDDKLYFWIAFDERTGLFPIPVAQFYPLHNMYWFAPIDENKIIELSEFIKRDSK